MKIHPAIGYVIAILAIPMLLLGHGGWLSISGLFIGVFGCLLILVDLYNADLT